MSEYGASDKEKVAFRDELLPFLRELRNSVGSEIEYYRLVGDLVARLMSDDDPTSAASAYRRERLCLVALCQTALLDDWLFEDNYLESMCVLADMHEFKKNDSNYKSPFDLACIQITKGVKYVRAKTTDSNEGETKEAWEWKGSLLRRNDGVSPAERGGLSADDDFTAKLYLTFSKLPVFLREQSVIDLKARLKYLIDNPEVYQDIVSDFEINVCSRYSIAPMP